MNPTQPSQTALEGVSINSAKAGALAAFGMASCYIIMFIIYGAILTAPASDDVLDKIQFVQANQDLIGFTYVLGYLLFGCFLLITTIALHNSVKSKPSILLTSGTAFGLIWVVLMMCSGMIGLIGMQTMLELHSESSPHAVSLFYSYGVITNALGGGIELVGGLWVLFISLSGMRHKRLPRALHILGVIVGSLGVLTLVQSVPEFKMAFGLSQIAWFAWVGFALLGDKVKP